METQNRPSTSEDSFENYYLQDHYLEDIYIVPGCKDPTLKSQMNDVSNWDQSGEIEKFEVRRRHVNEYFSCLESTGNSKKVKKPESVSRLRASPDSGCSLEKSSRAVSRVNLMDYIKENSWKVTGKRGRDGTVLHVLPGFCTCSLPPAISKGLRWKLESTMEGVNRAEELGGFLMKKRKVCEYAETDDEDSLDSLDGEKASTSDDEIKPLDENVSDRNPVENPVSSEDPESKPISKDKRIKIKIAPKSEEKDKKRLIVFGPRGEKTAADSKGEEPKSSKESQRRVSDDSKEYECDVCGASFKSFQALGGHKSSHRIRVKKEKVGDDNHVKKNRLEMISQAQEVGEFVFMKRKLDEDVETENQDSSDDDSLGSRPQNPMCSKECDVKDSDHNQQPNQESQKRGSDDPKEYKCTTCGASFNSFRALGGHRSSHTRHERVGDDNQVKENRLEMMRQAGELPFKKRKIDEHVNTKNQDSINDDKINEFELKKNDHTLLLPNPKCSDDSSSSRPQNPTSSEESDVKDIDRNQQPNPNSSDDFKCSMVRINHNQPPNPICSDDSESNMMAMEKKNNFKIVISRRAKKPAADSEREEPKSSQKSETNGSENSKEYKCDVCGKSFKSFRALGGHKSNHTIRVRRESVGDDNDVNNRNKIKKMSSGSDEVEESHGCNVCQKSFKTSKQLKMHERCHGSNVGSQDQSSQSPSTPSGVLDIDLNEPARVEDSDPSFPF